MLKLNWYDNTARMHDPVLMRFASPDPLWTDYPSTSAWTHCAANPANAIDPDGRDEFSVSGDGYFSLIKKTEDGITTICSEVTGKVLKFKTPNFEFHFEIDSNVKQLPNATTDAYISNGYSVEILEFLSSNTNVEWGKHDYSFGISMISTSHFKDKLLTDNKILEKFSFTYKFLLQHSHNHPSNSHWASKGDVYIATKIQEINDNVNFRIYIPK